jgi:urease accessory protein
VGFWAAQLGGRAVWQVPAALVVTLAAGAGMAVLGVGLPAVEPGIMASVLVLGLLIAFTVRLRPVPAMALVGAFALFHGHAHGAEMPAAANPFLYAGGFALATALLHGVGVGLDWAVGRTPLPALARAAGAAFAVTGLWGLILAL